MVVACTGLEIVCVCVVGGGGGGRREGGYLLIEFIQFLVSKLDTNFIPLLPERGEGEEREVVIRQ